MVVSEVNKVGKFNSSICSEGENQVQMTLEQHGVKGASLAQ